MTREQYNTQRTKLMNDMRAAIDAGDTATANSCRDQVRALDTSGKPRRRRARILPRCRTAPAALPPPT